MKSFKQFIHEEQFQAPGFSIARISMPQIKIVSHFENYVQHLGIKTSYKQYYAPNLRPTQTDFDQTKVDRIIADQKIDSKPIIVSSDGYILDGHHRYQAAVQTMSDISVLEIDLPINKLLKLSIDYVELYG